MSKKKLCVHLGRISKTPTPIEIFPDPAEIFADYNEFLAARVLPVISFDLALAGETGRAVFLYYDDYSVTFLAWKTDGKRITSVDDKWIKRMRQFDDKPDREALQKSVGRYLALDSYNLTVEPPESEPENEWSERYDEAIEDSGAENWSNRPRIGRHYPCYVQSHDMYDDSLIVGELPTNFLNLPPMYLYLSAYQGSFQQEMQMT